MQRVADAKVSLDAYPVETPRPRGAVIVLPGGGYHVHAAHEDRPIAEWLNREGFHAFVLRYRFAPHRHPAPLEDAARAVRLVRHRAKDWKAKPDRVAVLGFSAGGHLAATIGTHYDRGRPVVVDPVERESSRPDAIILCYAVTSFNDPTVSVCVKNILGENPSAEALRELSNELHVTADTPPAFIWHTAEDEMVPVEHSLVFASAMKRAGVPFELHVFPHGRHGLGLAEGTNPFKISSPEVAEWRTLCVRWLHGLGF